MAEEEKELQPFHKLIVGEMQVEARRVIVSVAAEHYFRKLGDILAQAIMPPAVVKEVVAGLKDIEKGTLHFAKDTQSARQYLERLIQGLEARLAPRSHEKVNADLQEIYVFLSTETAKRLYGRFCGAFESVLLDVDLEWRLLVKVTKIVEAAAVNDLARIHTLLEDMLKMIGVEE